MLAAAFPKGEIVCFMDWIFEARWHKPVFMDFMRNIYIYILGNCEKMLCHRCQLRGSKFYQFPISKAITPKKAGYNIIKIIILAE